MEDIYKKPLVIFCNITTLAPVIYTPVFVSYVEVTWPQRAASMCWAGELGENYGYKLLLFIPLIPATLQAFLIKKHKVYQWVGQLISGQDQVQHE